MRGSPPPLRAAIRRGVEQATTTFRFRDVRIDLESPAVMPVPGMMELRTCPGCHAPVDPADVSLEITCRPHDVYFYRRHVCRYCGFTGTEAREVREGDRL